MKNYRVIPEDIPNINRHSGSDFDGLLDEFVGIGKNEARIEYVDMKYYSLRSALESRIRSRGLNIRVMQRMGVIFLRKKVG